MADNGSRPFGRFSKDFVDNSSEIRIRKLIENRASEIAMTLKDVRKKLPKLAAQQVPRHMRRRSVSHNVKRLPQRIQERAKKDVTISKKSKRPSRKYRRRPSNLLEGYGRRQGPGKPTWLETHVWFAKRFHMATRWGYKLPLTSNDKGARATYRSASNFCLLHDLSYYGCIELLGPQDTLLQGLRQVCSQETGLTFAAKMYLPGTREGTLVLYRANSYPYKAIGPVSFLWKPVPPDKEACGVRQLWIWTHPSCYKEAVTVIGTIFGLSVSNLEVSSEPKLTASSEALDNVLESNTLETTLLTKSNPETADITISPKPLSYDKKVLPTISINKTDIKSITKLEHIIPSNLLPSELKEISSDTVISIKNEKLDINGNLNLGDKNSKKLTDSVQNVSKESAIRETNILSGKNKSCLKRKPASDFRKRATKKLKFNITVSDTPKIRETHEEENIFTNGTVTLRMLKDELIRFRLTGPRSHAVLVDTLQTVSVSGGSGDTWWKGQYGMIEERQELLKIQSALWEEQKVVSSAACLCPGYALALTIRDPRVIALPKSKVNALSSLDSLPSFVCQPPPACSSLGPIWDQDVRDDVKETMIPQKEIDNLKSLLTIPGSDLELGDKENKIPLMLIQNAGHGFSGCSSGWDLILPSGWAMAFWISLVYRGARVSSLQELHRSCVDQETPLFPHHYADTHSGAEHQESRRKELLTKHFRYPPDKRPNFVKLGVASPFSSPWKELVCEWKGAPCERVFILRNKRVLKQLSDCLTIGQPLEAFLRQPKFDDALVFVSAECLFKGVPSEFDTLCLPEAEDFFQLKHITDPSGPTEKPHRLKKGMLKEKQKTKKVQELLEKPPKVEGLLELCSRKPVGYLAEGRFSFQKAKGAGIGFCAYKALLRLADVCHKSKSKLTVLVRAHNSMQYRFAQLKVVP